MSTAVVIKLDNVTEADTALITRLMEAVEITDYKLINIKYYRLSSNNSFCICMGKAALAASKALYSKEKIIEIPELKALYDIPINSKDRATAYHLLKDLHKYIDIQSTLLSERLSEKQLPNLDSKSLLKIKEDLLIEGVLGFSAINQDGKVIRIRIDESDNVTEDINIHISELIALKLVHEVFQIKEPVIINRKEKGE
jgi:hypothetical protein